MTSFKVDLAFGWAKLKKKTKNKKRERQENKSGRSDVMGKKRVLIGYGVDVDAVSGWLGSYGGEDSSNDISRGKDSPKLDSQAADCRGRQP